MFNKKVTKYIKANKKQRLQEYLTARQNMRKIGVYLLAGIAMAVLVIGIPWGIATVVGEDVSKYQVQQNTLLLFDDDLLLEADERENLLQAIQSTIGQYYKIVFVNTNCENGEELLKQSNVIWKELENSTHGYTNYAMAVLIIHNEADDTYYLSPAARLQETGLFNTIRVSEGLTAERLLATNTSYANILQGEPYEVYTNVFNYVKEHGYTDGTGEEYYENCLTDGKFFDWFLGCLIDLFAGSMGVICISAWSSDFVKKMGEISDSDEERVMKIREKIQEQQKEQEEQEEKIAQKEKESSPIAQTPITRVIEALDKLESNHPMITEKKELLISNLYVLTKVQHKLQRSNLDFYLDNFVIGVNDIVEYVDNHDVDVDFNHPDVVAMTNDALDLFIQITNSFVVQSKMSKSNNIVITMDVLKQKAVLDGLIDGLNL